MPDAPASGAAHEVTAGRWWGNEARVWSNLVGIGAAVPRGREVHAVVAVVVVVVVAVVVVVVVVVVVGVGACDSALAFALGCARRRSWWWRCFHPFFKLQKGVVAWQW